MSKLLMAGVTDLRSLKAAVKHMKPQPHRIVLADEVFDKISKELKSYNRWAINPLELGRGFWLIAERYQSYLDQNP